MSLKKVLIITYYWPPSGGSGVQRWVKFSKYLRDYGWEPVIYTPSNPERPVIDKSLFKDVHPDIEIITTPIIEPYFFYKKFVGLKKDDNLGSGLMSSGKESTLLQKISIWIRGNMFIPDARKFWVKPSIKFLNKYLENNHIDVLVSTGPPHSMHLIAERVSKNKQIPWLSDFRDPWTNIDFFEDLKLSKFARKKHHILEKRILDNSDSIVVISPTMKKEFNVITDSTLSVITNGFDGADFKENIPPDNSKFTLSHIGMMTPTRNPMVLWKVLKELCDEDSEFSNHFNLQLVGKVDVSVRQSIIEHGLENIVTLIAYVPHSEIVKLQQKSDALLLIVNNTPNANLILTGKFFEYLAAKRPIVCISPVEGDMSDILLETKAGTFVKYSEKEKLKSLFKKLMLDWKLSNVDFNPVNISKYSRTNLSKTLAQKLDELIK